MCNSQIDDYVNSWVLWVLSKSKDVYVRVIGDSKLAKGGNGCLINWADI